MGRKAGDCLIAFFVSVAGAIFGVFIHKIATALIDKRTPEPLVHSLINGKFSMVLWAVANGVGWLIIQQIKGLGLTGFELMLIYSVCLMISVIDAVICKIPNQLVATVGIFGFALLFQNYSFNNLTNSLVGLLCGTLIFILPFFFGKKAGGGDVKLIGVIGFCLGFPKILTALIITSTFLLIYAAYLVLTKKGSLKTGVAMGSFISAGFIMAMLL